MKWIIILSILAASCSGQKIKKQPQHASPYTVEKCQCMKIFDPVCAEGKNFGNSCEAECNGYLKWTAGGCAPVQIKKTPKK